MPYGVFPAPKTRSSGKERPYRPASRFVSGPASDVPSWTRELAHGADPASSAELALRGRSN